MILKIEIPDKQAEDFIRVFSSQHGYRDRLTTAETGVEIDNPESRLDFFKRHLEGEIIGFYRRAKTQEMRQKVADESKNDFSLKVL